MSVCFVAFPVISCNYMIWNEWVSSELFKYFGNQGHTSLLLFFHFRSLLKATVVLLPLLGLTWVFGLLTVDQNTIFFAWIFTILNSLQVLKVKWLSQSLLFQPCLLKLVRDRVCIGCLLAIIFCGGTTHVEGIRLFPTLFCHGVTYLSSMHRVLEFFSSMLSETNW